MRHAWIAALALLGLGPAGQDDERGVQLYEQGQYAEAAAAFRAAIEAAGPTAERAYNLALALWKAGDLDEAETAAEEAATLSDGALNPLRDGMLGNLRYAAAEAKQEEDLQAALELAKQAKAHYLRGALAGGARPELARNLERALKLIEDLEKKIEEQEKQQQENEDQKQDSQDQQESEDQEKNDQQQDQKEQEQKQDEKQQDEKQQDEKQQDPQQNEPENEPQQQPEPEEEEPPQEPKQEGQDQQQEEQQQEPPPPAPGEQQEGRELTPEEKKRLLDKLKQLDAMRLELRERQKAKRPVVEKDW